MDHLTDRLLIDTYHRALTLRLSTEFIQVLEEELYERALRSTT